MKLSDTQKISAILPLKNSPLIHCITNDITIETVANSILYIGGKPIMSSDVREFSELFKTTRALFLNMGRMTENHEQSLKLASHYAHQTQKPTVVDLVGYGITPQRTAVGKEITSFYPDIVKGNISEMRRFVGLSSTAKGIDRSEEDQNSVSLKELMTSLKVLASKFPKTVFVATGPSDIIVQDSRHLILNNGVKSLDRIVGTGDLVGAIMATVLGAGHDSWLASLFSISYINIAGEKASIKTKGQGLESFRQSFLDEISILWQDENWIDSLSDDEY